MNIFQVGGLIFSATMIILCLIAMKRRTLRHGIGSLWILFWLATATAILKPDITRVIAMALGIGRGADLVFYFGILATAIGFFLFFLRFKKLETDITKVVRHIAVQEAKKAKQSSITEEEREKLPDGLSEEP